MTHPPRDRRSGGADDGDVLHRVSSWLDDEIDAATVAAVEARLLNDPAARRAYVEAMLLDADLAAEFSSAGLLGMIDTLAPPADADEPTTACPARGATGWSAVRGLGRFAAAVAIAIVVGTIGGGLVAWQVVRASGGGPWRTAVAEISRVRLAVPAARAGGTPERPLERGLERGRVLPRGRISIASGGMELAMLNGAMLVVEGPTELELVGPERAFLHHGVAVIRLPPGGAEFELETPTARVLGGGEFGAKVDASLTTDVQVYLGTAIVSAVATLGGGQFPERFGAGEAVRISSRADAVPARIAFAEQRFLRRVPDDTAGQGVGVVAADDPKAGRASRESIVVTRPQTPVVIDGRLEEWDAAPGFRRSRHGGTHDSEWIEGRMMYDAERLYVAARVGDPLPMRNSVDHAFDAGLVWQGGGLQLFFSGDRAAGWPADANAPGYYENRKRVASFAERVKAENPRLMTLIMTHHAPSGTDRLFIGRSLVGDRTTMPAPDAFEGRFRMHPDGRGYVLEYAIPWSTLGLDDDPPQPGDDLAVAWELHFSEETGRLWRDQIVDVRNPAEPWDIFLFERANTWGRAEFR